MIVTLTNHRDLDVDAEWIPECGDGFNDPREGGCWFYESVIDPETGCELDLTPDLEADIDEALELVPPPCEGDDE